MRSSRIYNSMQNITPSSAAMAFPWRWGLQLRFPTAWPWDYTAEGAVSWGVLLWPCRVVIPALSQNPQLPCPALQISQQQREQRNCLSPGVRTVPALASLLVQPQLQLLLQQWEVWECIPVWARGVPDKHLPTFPRYDGTSVGAFSIRPVESWSL